MNVLYSMSVYIVVVYSPVFSFNYCSITCDGKRHTMCAYKKGGGSECNGFRRGLAQAEKDFLVKVHNELRDLVAMGSGDPNLEAANMMKMEWSKEGEAIAQRWADQCALPPEQSDRCRSLQSQEQGGQIMSTIVKTKEEDTYSLLRQTVMQWFTSNRTAFDESTLQSYKYDPKSFAFAQIVWARTSHVGCGLSVGVMRGKVEHRFVCNYYPAGLTEGDPVYIVGKVCSKCPFVQCSVSPRGLCEHQSGTVWNRNKGNKSINGHRVVLIAAIAIKFSSS